MPSNTLEMSVATKPTASAAVSCSRGAERGRTGERAALPSAGRARACSWPRRLPARVRGASRPGQRSRRVQPPRPAPCSGEPCRSTCGQSWWSGRPWRGCPRAGSQRPCAGVQYLRGRRGGGRLLLLSRLSGAGPGGRAGRPGAALSEPAPRSAASLLRRAASLMPRRAAAAAAACQRCSCVRVSCASDARTQQPGVDEEEASQDPALPLGVCAGMRQRRGEYRSGPGITHPRTGARASGSCLGG